MPDIILHIAGTLLTLAYLAGVGFISFAWSNGDQQTANRFGTLFVIIYFLVVYALTSG
jgi:ABC-type multidrug transport system permease subunit